MATAQSRQVLCALCGAAAAAVAGAGAARRCGAAAVPPVMAAMQTPALLGRGGATPVLCCAGACRLWRQSVSLPPFPSPLGSQSTVLVAQAAVVICFCGYMTTTTRPLCFPSMPSPLDPFQVCSLRGTLFFHARLCASLVGLLCSHFQRAVRKLQLDSLSESLRYHPAEFLLKKIDKAYRQY